MARGTSLNKVGKKLSFDSDEDYTESHQEVSNLPSKEVPFASEVQAPAKRGKYILDLLQYYNKNEPLIVEDYPEVKEDYENDTSPVQR
jgi:hypothetical protein